MYKDRWSNKFDIWYLKFKIWDFMKKNYINPSVQVAQIALESMVLAGSSHANTMDIHSDIPSDQWWLRLPVIGYRW